MRSEGICIRSLQTTDQKRWVSQQQLGLQHYWLVTWLPLICWTDLTFGPQMGVKSLMLTLEAALPVFIHLSRWVTAEVKKKKRLYFCFFLCWSQHKTLLQKSRMKGSSTIGLGRSKYKSADYKELQAIVDAERLESHLIGLKVHLDCYQYCACA